MSGLRRSQSGTRGVRRVVRKQVGAALEALGDRGLSSDETIHDTRKRLKRVRAGLRLLREVIGKGPYRRENALIRDAFRPLTELRDAKVLLDAFDADISVADGFQPESGVLVDDGLLAILLLHIQPERQHADDRHQRKGDDAETDGNFDEGKRGRGSNVC